DVEVIGKLVTDARVEWQKEAPGLAGDRVAEIPANVRARVQGEEPPVGQREVQHRSKLEIIYVFPRWIAREAVVPPRERFEIASAADFRQCVAKSRYRHDLPLSRSESIAAGGADEPDPGAGLPTII